MKKLLSVFIISLLFTAGITALEVNERELKVARNETI